ncbi:MAG: hypothetical protein EHM41_19135 [Chloroflexi bacterium]|nr:MAG: hypothetical protein EHM41_19135 [Chloroflexota bacterium]
MGALISGKILAEEQIVAKLAILGINYLSRSQDLVVKVARSRERLLADLIRQSSSRVRLVIILLLAHPDFASVVPNIKNATNPPAS